MEKRSEKRPRRPARPRAAVLPELAHYRRLGHLRSNAPALRAGDIRFFKASNQQVGFTRSCPEQTLRIYVNRSGDPWEIPASRVLLGRNLQSIAHDTLCLAPMGYCVVEDEA